MSLRQGSPLYWFLVLLFCLSWSSAYPTAKLAIAVSPPMLFLGVRFLLAAALLMAYAAIRREIRGPIPWVGLAILGLLNLAAYQGLFWEAMRTESAGMAVVVGSLVPILTAACAAPMLGERLTVAKFTGLLLGLGGRGLRGAEPAGNGRGPGRHAVSGRRPGGDDRRDDPVQEAGPGDHPVRRRRRAAIVGRRCPAGHRPGDRGPVAILPGPAYVLTMLWFVLVVSVGAMLLWFLLLRSAPRRPPVPCIS